ncbi:hypothetical protein LTR62_001251 [Meristemomyces frigidus]|uniref:Uncharacterized protein n=1 Tax=Meristemomyces frigidus TaxID=1508187 RepID=A0AAN7T9H4_9PEZI|nr:hypothetical protein LTR62_001251 [Meristemomyces frigidus]
MDKLVSLQCQNVALATELRLVREQLVQANAATAHLVQTLLGQPPRTEPTETELLRTKLHEVQAENEQLRKTAVATYVRDADAIQGAWQPARPLSSPFQSPPPHQAPLPHQPPLPHRPPPSHSPGGFTEHSGSIDSVAHELLRCGDASDGAVQQKSDDGRPLTLRARRQNGCSSDELRSPLSSASTSHDPGTPQAQTIFRARNAHFGQFERSYLFGLACYIEELDGAQYAQKWINIARQKSRHSAEDWREYYELEIRPTYYESQAAKGTKAAHVGAEEEDLMGFLDPDDTRASHRVFERRGAVCAGGDSDQDQLLAKTSKRVVSVETSFDTTTNAAAHSDSVFSETDTFETNFLSRTRVARNDSAQAVQDQLVVVTPEKVVPVPTSFTTTTTTDSDWERRTLMTNILSRADDVLGGTAQVVQPKEVQDLPLSRWASTLAFQSSLNPKAAVAPTAAVTNLLDHASLPNVDDLCRNETESQSKQDAVNTAEHTFHQTSDSTADDKSTATIQRGHKRTDSRSMRRNYGEHRVVRPRCCSWPCDEYQLLHSNFPHDQSAMRSVMINNIPAGTLLVDVLDKVRGGKIISATYISLSEMRTSPAMKTDVVMVTFLYADRARAYAEFCSKNDIFVTSDTENLHKLEVTHIPKPVRPPVMINAHPAECPSRILYLLDDEIAPTKDAKTIINMVTTVLNQQQVPAYQKYPLRMGRDEDGILCFEFASIGDAVDTKQAMERLHWDLGGMKKGYLGDPCERGLASLLTVAAVGEVREVQKTEGGTEVKNEARKDEKEE